MSYYVISLTLLISLLATFGTIQSRQDSRPDTDDPYFIKNKCIESLNGQVNEELRASLTYLNMAAHFQHNEVARKGFFRFFQEQSDEEKKHAHKLIHYINKRGGRVGAFDVTMPDKVSWGSAVEAVQDAINLERELNVKLHLIHKTAETQCQDPHLMDFLEAEYLEEQISSINSLTKLLTTLKQFGTGNGALGEYHVDRELLEESGRHYYEKEL